MRNKRKEQITTAAALILYAKTERVSTMYNRHISGLQSSNTLLQIERTSVFTYRRLITQSIDVNQQR